MSTNKEAPPQEEKKKKRVIVVAACPPAVATAYCILRGAVCGVVGANMQEATCSLMQPTYIKDGANTGKFSIHLGKKLGCGELELPEDAQEQAHLLDAIQAAANRVVSEDKPIATFQMSKQKAVEKYGSGILDGSHKKTKDNDVLTVCSIDGLVLAVAPAVPYASTGGSMITSIALDFNQCNVVCGKKARKAEVTLKFRVECSNSNDDNGTLATVGDAAVPVESIAMLQKAKIRMPEGQALKDAAMALVQEQLVAATIGRDAKKPKDDDNDEMVVNAFEVSGKIDYDRLVEKFGSRLIDEELMRLIQEQTVGQGRVPYLHRFLRRGIFFSHRDLAPLLQGNSQDMYLYTGRGPSSGSMHLGHLVPFLFTKWLQDAFDCPLVIQMTDDEKFLFKGQYDEHDGDNLDYFCNLTIENARDIIACGFQFNKTFLFSDMDYVGTMYPNIVRIWKAVTTNTVNGIFGFDGTSNTGKIAFPAIQAAPSFASSFPTVLGADRKSSMACLIPCAIDQDPYFRMTRDVAHKLVLNKQHKLVGKPALIHSKFFPPLQGATGKMSSSDPNSAIFLTDTPEDIERKIKQYAFSGGQETKKLQEELGADLEVDVSYQWLRFFLEDDNELATIGESYGAGKGDYWSTGKVKEKLIDVLQKLVAEHQERRAKITDEEVQKWMKERFIGGK